MYTKDGKAVVRLMAQDEMSVCHWTDEAGREHSAPSHEFYADFRQATPDEISAAKDRAKPAKEPAK